MLLFFQAVLAAPADAPWQLPLELQPEGVSRVSLPAEVAATTDADVASRLMLVGPDGETRAFTLAASGEHAGPQEEYLSVRPVSPGVWEVEAADRPVTALRLTIDDLGEDGPVEVRVGDGAPEVVYDAWIEGSNFQNQTVAVPRQRGPLLVTLRSFHDRPVRLDAAHGRRDAIDHVPEFDEKIPVEAPAFTEEGRARYAVRLPGLRRVRGVTLVVTDDLFARDVEVRIPDTALDPFSNGAPLVVGSGRVSRLALLGARIDNPSLTGLDFVGDRLMLDVTVDQGRELAVTDVIVHCAALDLLARDPGAGPFTLFVGGGPWPAGTDLSLARNELLALAGERRPTGPLVPNPDYVAVPDREGLAEQGSVLTLARFRWARAIAGAAGWARVVFDAHVLAAARVDMGDIRVVDAEGRQLPFVLRRTGRELPLPVEPFVRTEREGVTELRAALTAAEAPVETLTLRTGRNTFERGVTVLRDRGATTEPLRRVTWSGGRQGNLLSLALSQPLGREILVRIDNGDNPPLPVESIHATTAEWELRVRLPGEGVRLVYGAAGMDRPTYDLTSVSHDVFSGPVADVTLGAPAELGGVQASGADRLGVAIALGVLAIGLAGMLVRVLRGASEAE